jgi:predicted site-specific integrase-resolvase
MKIINNQKLYSLQDLTNKLGVAYQTVWKWKNSGKLPMIHILRRDYIEEEVFNNIERYL